MTVESHDAADEPLRLIRELCSQSADHANADAVLAARAAAIARSASEPVRIAVTGRVNAGKSTLVNALVGQHVARTGPVEATAHVIRYRFGQFDHVDVVDVDGRRVPLRAAPDAIPSDVGIPATRVDHIEVFLSTRELTDMILVDTPGLESLTEDRSVRTTRLLGSAGADVDAAIVVLDADSGLVAQQHRVVENYLASREAAGGTVVGVLSKADTAGDGRDPWPDAEKLARSAAAALPGVGTVHALCTLLAETVSAGLFTQALADDLATLAASVPRTRTIMLLSADRFTATDDVLDAERRGRLLERLGLYGVRVALGAIDGGATSATEVADALRAASRIDELREVLRRRVLAHASTIKAAAALDQFEALLRAPELGQDARLWLGDQVEELRLDPRLHPVLEHEALAALWSGAARLPEELSVAFERLVGGADDADRIGVSATADPRTVTAAARELGGRFRTHAFRTNPRAAWLAVVAERSCLLITQRARARRGPSGGPGRG
ncbi:MAG TPA: GTPase [Actinomycetospora sp.]|uniref:GTPase n=1 Tax=Actinomycetospora sp. TaxID=1872135 RepID=UPI002F4044C5